MTNQTATQPETNDRPAFRVSFSRIIGQDANGRDKLGPAREIGAIWNRKSDKKGYILKLDHVPTELVNHQGAMFVLPVEPKNQ